MRKNQGITLIALVVTIVVLLILAVVSINVVFGDDGIFGTAKQAANQTANAAHFEANILGTELQTFVDEAVNGTGGNGGTTPPTQQDPLEPEEPTPAQTLVSQVSSSNYGQTVTYTSPNGVSDWKIFYSDGSNVFIIASDYVENSKVAITELGMTTNGTYNVYWTSFPDTSLTVGNWMLSGNNTFTQSNTNYYATAGLMNTSKWTNFVNSTYADSAIGGPTLDMYIASWNDKYPSNPLYLSANSTGYYAGKTENPTDIHVTVTDIGGTSNILYYPFPGDWNGCDGFWLASPSADGVNGVVYMHGNGILSVSGTSNTKRAVRPVVCLKSTVKGTLSGTNWTLE